MEGNVFHILLSVQRGLLDHIAPLLRAVTVDFDKKQSLMTLHFFYDGEVTDRLFDLASCTCVEIDPGVFPYMINDDFTTRLDYPAKIPIQGRLVYLRKEPTPTIYKQKSAVLFADSSNTLVAVLLLAMQDALLGKVTPELREVTVNTDEATKQLDFYFFYDGAISKENFNLANSSIQEASIWFPGYSVNKNILRLDFPEKISPLGGRVPYARDE